MTSSLVGGLVGQKTADDKVMAVSEIFFIERNKKTHLKAINGRTAKLRGQLKVQYCLKT